MEEEVEFIYEMLHSHSPTCERVWLPKGPPKFAQPRDGVAALKQRLGHERVSIINPFTLTQERQTTCSGLYYAYIHPEGSSPPALWEMLLRGAHVMATERNSPETAKRLYKRVVDLQQKSDNADFLYSLYRHLQTVPSLDLDRDFHDVVTRCRSFDIIDQAFRQRRAQRQARLLAWSAPPPPTASGSGSGMSLLDLLRMLPPPFTPADLLPLGSLVAMARTSREWYAYVAGSQLPLLQRRAMNDEALAPMKWSYSHSYEGPTEDVWATCSLTYSSSLSTASTSTTNSEASSLFPIIECPPLLRYLLAHAVSVGSARSPAAAVEALLGSWRLSTIFDPACPSDTIKRCLRLLSGTAVAAATYSKKEIGFPTQSDNHMICLYLPADDATDASPSAGMEVVCEVGWGVHTPYWY